MKFWFHYNKPASRRTGKPQISLHYQSRCHTVRNVKVHVPTFGRIRRKQPRFVMCGDATEIVIKDGVAIIK